MRSTPGKPTSVPGGAPAFRGKPNKPGASVGAPAIRTSYNRQDRGTNVLIPYSRVVPLHHLTHVGRVQPGDVVFSSSYRVNRTYDVSEPRNPDPNGANPTQGDRVETASRIVGIDWLNAQLGGRPEYDTDVNAPEGKHVGNWMVGENVILGAPAPDNANLVNALTQGGATLLSEEWDPVRDNVADEWRSLPILREWTCDGVVLSNDAPGCHTSNGDRDGQLFNIAVQGVCPVSNGYCTQTPHSNRTLTNACGGTAHAWPGPVHVTAAPTSEAFSELCHC